MDSKLFSLDRSIQKIETKDELKIMHTLVWKIPNFMWLLNNQTNREISTLSKIEQPIEVIEHNEMNEPTETEALKGRCLTKEGDSDIDSDNSDSDTEDATDNLETDDVEESEFQVKIELVGRENDLIEIYYMAHDTLTLKPSCSVLHDDQSYYDSLTNDQYRLVDKNKWQLLAIQYKRQLAGRCENIFTLKFEFLVAQEKEKGLSKLMTVEDEKIIVPTMPEIKVIDELSVLVMNDAYSDVTVRSTEGLELPAHKALLGVRSPVFKALFDHDMVESNTNIVDSPFQAIVLKELLRYIYTNTAPNINKLPRKLLVAADYYHINGLKSLCEITLARKLSIKNAIKTLELANLYGAVYLKRKTLEFIKNGAAADVTETDGWRASGSAGVIKSVYECVVRNKIDQI